MLITTNLGHYSFILRFLKKLRLKQRENYIVDSIADILVEFFSAVSAQKLKSAYGELKLLKIFSSLVISTASV